jgi:hypothetical protein
MADLSSLSTLIGTLSMGANSLFGVASQGAALQRMYEPPPAMTQTVPCLAGFEPVLITTPDGHQQSRCYNPETKELR